MSEAVLQAIALQVDWCVGMQAPFSAAVLQAIGRSVAAGGPFAALFTPWTSSSRQHVAEQAVALRALGGLHDLVLSGEAPELAAFYDQAADPAHLAVWRDRAALDEALSTEARSHAARLQAFMTSPPQTNEVRRSACLLGGFLTVAAQTGLPLRCFEIGGSAGLNQIWDRYGYDLGAAGWRGDVGAPVALHIDWEGPPPPDPAWPQVIERRGCDQAPVDLDDPLQVRRLEAYVWAEQTERRNRLRAAIALARMAGVRLEKADAADWVEANVAPVEGAATVLYHSIVRQYLSEASRSLLDGVIGGAAAAADTHKPFAVLAMELQGGGYEVELTCWPGGETRRLASVHPHGAWVTWKAGAESTGAERL